MKEKNIYFKDLPALLQQKILDMYGAENAAELGLDIKPWATVYEDSDEVGALGVFEPAVQLTTYICNSSCLKEGIRSGYSIDGYSIATSSILQLEQVETEMRRGTKRIAISQNWRECEAPPEWDDRKVI